MRDNKWILYAGITILSWGIWGAFIEIPEKAGFPATLGYCAWAITMIPCSLYALWRNQWKLSSNLQSISLGMFIGLSGAGGQLILFKALETGPAYIVFPLISLSPVVTILMSVWLLRETALLRQWAGIVLSLIAITLLSYQDPDNELITGYNWLVSSILVFMMWGVQGYFMKLANKKTEAESIFFYMMLSGILLIPYALFITDDFQSVNWGPDGFYLALGVQFLNALGALTLVYAYRKGKAIIVSPLTALAPVITVILSLVIYSVIPGSVISSGMVLAIVAIFLMI